MATVELHNVSRHFDTASGVVRAVTALDLVVNEGEFLCVVGPSGCGKSTLLNLIAGFERPDVGRVLVDSAEVVTPGPERFVIFQEPALFPWLNVRQNVAFGLKVAGLPRPEQELRVNELLQLVQLSRFADAWIHELSGGMKQRVALARALALDPAILLMDEPFAALDAQTRDLLHEELERIWQRTGKTIIFVTHNVREAVRLGTRVILMSPHGAGICREYPVDLPRGRFLEDVSVVRIAAVIRDDLRREAMIATEGC
ncbi:MAG TPA: ABC transporter ATP-binding protein, partial [Dongiaceae bacterium]|nr:ABC transporter ATP-binding protein [Dongiaceae bacterium]